MLVEIQCLDEDVPNEEIDKIGFALSKRTDKDKFYNRRNSEGIYNVKGLKVNSILEKVVKWTK